MSPRRPKGVGLAVHGRVVVLDPSIAPLAKQCSVRPEQSGTDRDAPFGQAQLCLPEGGVEQSHRIQIGKRVGADVHAPSLPPVRLADNRHFVILHCRGYGHIVIPVVAASPVSLCLRDVLEHHLDGADPHVLTAHDRLDRPVGWVHSSEIFEIGPLLSGGELLLTTGLGLAGLDAGTRRHYVRDLAERGVAGLAFEIGRTFDAIPDEMVREGSACRLPIIELRRVQPFIEVCRRANTAIVSAEVDDLRLRTRLDAALHAELTSSGGVAGMLGHLADAIGSPIVLIGSQGALLAAHGVDDDRAAWRIVDGAPASVTITVRGREIGRLVAGGSHRSGSRAEALLDLAAGPLAAALTRAGTRGSAVGVRLVEEIVDGRPIRRVDLLARLVSSGVGVRDSSLVVPVAAEAPDPRMAESALARTGGALGGLVQATVDATVYGLIVVPSAPDPVGQTARALEKVGSAAIRSTFVVGEATGFDDSAPGAGLSNALTVSLRRCGERIALADTLRRDAPARRVFTGRELLADAAAHTIGAEVRAELTALMAPLVTHDRRHGGLLVTTLDTHLRHGCSATRSAQILHIGRQSMYQRLDRIRAVLGFDPTEPDVAASMLLAIGVHRADR